MVDTVTVEKIDEVFMKVTSDPGIRQELSEYFAFRAPGYQFNPKYQAKVWDGFIRMYNPFKPFLYVGLLDYLKKFCDDRDYEINIDEELILNNNIEEKDILDLAKEINLKFTLHDYQTKYILNSINSNRSLSLSPTSSGKSMIIYMLQQFYYRNLGMKTLIIVPTVGLVYQMAADFVDYGCDSESIHSIKAGAEKNTDKPIVISTWQSLIKQPKEWFNQFGVVLGDEAHLFQAKSLTSIMEKLPNAKYRHGFTGTISSDSKVHRLVLEGVFGQIRKYVSTKNLIDNGTVANFKIKALVLNYDEPTKKEFRSALNKLDKNKKYAAERTFLFSNTKRNNFLKNLVWSLENQNNLILFDQIEKHGSILEPLLRKEGRILHYIHGGTSGEERERIRQLIENDPEKRHDILASFGVFSTGVSIKRIDNAIFASSYKSEIKTLQSIGRTLRKGNGSDDATLYDITDNLSSKSYVNYTLQHFRKRVEIYSTEQFKYRIYNIDL